MHQHEHDDTAEQATLARRDTPGPDLDRLARAAVAGRPDVLGHAGIASLQRVVGNGAVGAALQRAGGGERAEDEERSSVHEVIGSAGQPLDADTRADMEGRFGTQFGDVRVHTGGAADDSARSVGAHAYTVGPNVVFQRDRYDPGSAAGRTMLAHELTHVVQQRGGPVDGTEQAGGIRVSDPSDRFERDAVANAERITSMPAPVQRAEDAAEEEEPADVQGSFAPGAAVQRAEDAAEEEAPAE
jgi:Domain of unknown function (DUF4157)